ncbi:tRNA (5-methylaminomethyl-2-thiouridine)(34)-methyltransferase MnmD [Mucilaginibacter segetis]|uniref:tRNA (5-methylaminomethyl-2-thiouridine)(34)-methyltransferase MnmD n=1 Tax=Mucilaginibacter segetis TaxID=2793071 RepID=A0A934ULX0_9SPHI|nr:tRNA (5-methylaminomethyl-2-thiouridine)(34)-methyltransferase MnmD [Mucilaginibacter segetis]MBK0378291.1 tRNA (5-methylaminomethyl-2-thiouridine)(34)-methyltransferase MnmD [Mucilaginibacter segetis]
MGINKNTEHLQLIITADGSNTIYNSIVGENYHSRNGALQESKHVFVHSGLMHFINMQLSSISSIKVLEVGFGTGLNFLLTTDICTEKQIKMLYTGIEAYPLNNNLISNTGYEQYISKPVWDKFLSVYSLSLTKPVALNSFCDLEVIPVPLADFDTTESYDVIYFDAFASTRQPEMWDEKAITHTLAFLKPGGVFVTYAITGNLKRIIKTLGLKVEKVPGAPGKREMLRATKPLA